MKKGAPHKSEYQSQRDYIFITQASNHIHSTPKESHTLMTKSFLKAYESPEFKKKIEQRK